MKKLFITILAITGLSLLLVPAAMAQNDHVQYQTSNSPYGHNYNNNHIDPNKYHSMNNQNSQGQWQSV